MNSSHSDSLPKSDIFHTKFNYKNTLTRIIQFNSYVDPVAVVVFVEISYEFNDSLLKIAPSLALYKITQAP